MNTRLTILSAIAIVGAVALSITGAISNEYWLLASSIIAGTVGASMPNKG